MSTNSCDQGRKVTLALLLMLGVNLIGQGCSLRVEISPDEAVLPSVDVMRWDTSAAEIISWEADRSTFDPDHALEASGLAISGEFLYLLSEKYASLLQLPLSSPNVAKVIGLSVPRFSELEGLTFADGKLLICDEAHAAVYEVAIPDEATVAAAMEGDGKLEVTRLTLPDLGVVGGKLGFEGLAKDSESGIVYLLLERSGSPSRGCRSTVFRLRRSGDALETAAEPIELELEDCTWRHTGLNFAEGRLLALKTSFPSFEYQIVAIDPTDGSVRLVQDLTAKSRSLAEQGFSNNLEGMVVGGGGELYIVSDNRDGAIVFGRVPPKVESRTLLLKLPLLDQAR